MNSNVTGKAAAKTVVKKSIDIFNSTATFEPRHENKSCSAFPEDELKSF